ncbi:hypothetical protein FORC17_3968 [Vibrio vulnificus]|uniref:Uncharacterized protein n=1 Tax=Vibrio vulnificus TaxID=672 RepID=A0AAN1UEA9_VIBVL|nr:hypothetical protein FORC17_3968 [Vibrio vulnificus]AXX62291.1 hypothetical protein FORC53_3952 [Vibrio vulnificus]QBH29457.1 hypothetical protein FORC77_3734 [Vibrio vulnificus]
MALYWNCLKIKTNHLTVAYKDKKLELGANKVINNLVNLSEHCIISPNYILLTYQRC